MEFIIVSGQSGAGKSKAAAALEDAGFYVVDNLPADLIPKFAELCTAAPGKYERVALVTDVRAGEHFEGLFAALKALEEMGLAYRILFMEASADTIIKRYKETRRSHPLARDGVSLEETIRLERQALEPVRRRAEYIVDTTAMNNAKIRGEILRLFGSGEGKRAMAVTVTSFGFKYGVPIEADLVFDARFLPNPYYVPELRYQTGLDAPVRDFVFKCEQTRTFMEKLEDLIGFLLPRFVEEGKSVLVIAVGCTGGRHRSVAVTRALAEFIRQKGYHAAENHRDMTRA